MLEKCTDFDLTLDTGTMVIRPLKSVHDLGVHLDSELTMKTHISKVVSCCYHQLRRIRQVRRLVWQDVTQQLVSAFILSRLDYCNSAAAAEVVVMVAVVVVIFCVYDAEL